jgi:hypothetical protein
LNGGEDATIFELRMSISLGLNYLLIFRNSLADEAKKNQGKVLQFINEYLEKFDQVNSLQN